MAGRECTGEGIFPGRGGGGGEGTLGGGGGGVEGLWAGGGDRLVGKTLNNGIIFKGICMIFIGIHYKVIM